MSFLKSAALELVVVLILSLLLIAGLNYFRVISLNTFPVFSFLPQQNLKNSLPAQLNTKTFAIITPNNLKTISNSSSGFNYQYISYSKVNVKGEIVIEGEISASSVAKKTISGSGISFKNPYNAFTPNERRLIISYDATQKNWTLEYRGNGKTRTYFLSKDRNPTPFIKFNLSIDSSGKSADVFVAGEKTSRVVFPESIYDKGRTMQVFAQTPPNSDITIYSLYYQYAP